jgi:hypothetical protein
MPRIFSKSAIWLLVPILLVLTTSCMSGNSKEGAVVQIEPSKPEAQAGEEIKTVITIQNVSNLTAFEAHLSFDTDKLEVVKVTNGGFIAEDFVAENTFDNNSGEINYAIAQINRQPASGDGVLFEVIFRALKQGDSVIRFRSTPAATKGILLSDSNGMEIQASSAEANVSVK